MAATTDAPTTADAPAPSEAPASSATGSGLATLALAPPPPPARPRVLLLGTAFASAACSMVFTGMLALYLSARAESLADTGRWLPENAVMPLTPANMGLITLVMSVVTLQWAVYAIGNDDRRNAYLALGLTALLGVAFVNLTAFFFTQMGLTVREPAGLLVFAIAGTHLAMVGSGLLFIALMAFRTLGGQYSARDREGLSAAALFWYATVAVYAAIWLAVYVTK